MSFCCQCDQPLSAQAGFCASCGAAVAVAEAGKPACLPETEYQYCYACHFITPMGGVCAVCGEPCQGVTAPETANLMPLVDSAARMGNWQEAHALTDRLLVPARAWSESYGGAFRT